jgi:hypothetical protein
MYRSEPLCWCCGAGDGRRVVPTRGGIACGVHPVCAECRRLVPGSVAVHRLRTNVGGTMRYLNAAEQRAVIAKGCTYR